MAEREPWQRLPDESPRAYAAFRVYRELPAKDRTAEKAAERAESPPGTVRKWCSKYRWVERATEWDDRRHSIEDTARLDKLREMHASHMRLGKIAQMKATQALSAMQPGDIPAGAAIRLLELGVRIEQTLLMTTPEQMLGKVEEDAQEDPFDAVGRILAGTG